MKFNFFSYFKNTYNYILLLFFSCIYSVCSVFNISTEYSYVQKNILDDKYLSYLKMKALFNNYDQISFKFIHLDDFEEPVMGPLFEKMGDNPYLYNFYFHLREEVSAPIFQMMNQMLSNYPFYYPEEWEYQGPVPYIKHEYYSIMKDIVLAAEKQNLDLNTVDPFILEKVYPEVSNATFFQKIYNFWVNFGEFDTRMVNFIEKECPTCNKNDAFINDYILERVKISDEEFFSFIFNKTEVKPIKEVFKKHFSNSFDFDYNLDLTNVFYNDFSWSLLFLFSISSIMFLFLFKWATWPAYNWSIFIYNLSNTGAAGFLSYSMKFVYALFIIILNIYIFSYLDLIWSSIFLIISVLSGLFAAMGAVNERFVKKFLLYSSLGHIAFILLGIVYFLDGGFNIMLIYLFIYSIMSNISWLFLVSSLNNIKLLNSFVLIINNDFISKLLISLNLFALSGLPPFSGFFVKFEMLLLAAYSSDFVVISILLLLSLITLFYYIRVVKILHFDNFILFNKQYFKENIILLLISGIFLIVIFFIIFFDISFVFIVQEVLKEMF